MAKTKLALGVAVALLVAAGAGWYWGASGRWAADRSLQAAELRSDLVEARGRLLDGRVALYNINFGEATGHLEAARGLLRSARERLNSLGRQDDTKRLDLALTKIDEAQRMAGQLDQGANTRVAEAVKTIEEIR